jgi:hypothetical protein
VRRRDGRLPAVVAIAALGLAIALDIGIAAHAATQPATPFDHGRTRFPLTGAHARVDCESCHLAGKMAGTPRTCAACHGGSGRGL